MESFGYNASLENYRLENGLTDFEPGRVTAEHRNGYDVITASGELDCELIGNLRFSAQDRLDLPVVGDWVAVNPYDTDKGLIHAVFPRHSLMQRKAAGNTSDAQPIAANVDAALIVQAMDRDFNLNRLERYLVLCQSSDVEPIVVLNKIDLIDDTELQRRIESGRKRSGNLRVIAISSELEGGYDSLQGLLLPAHTYCLLGSSGAGKSTITNFLAGSETMATSHVSGSVGKGRHTTTHRELHLLPSGSLLIDNPGMREVGLADGGEGLEATFESIAELAEQCRYRDCAHIDEPGCAVLEAIDNGEISVEAYENYLKLQRETKHYTTSLAERRQKDKQLGRIYRDIQKAKRQSKFNN